MPNIAWIQFIFDCFKSLYSFSKKGSFCQKTILILFVFVSINGYATYFLLRKDQQTPSKFENTVSDLGINQYIKTALNKCGGYVSWSVLEDAATAHGKYLHFKTVLGCDIDRTRFNEDNNCVVDIMFNNPIYLKKHFINKETLDFIESDPKLPNGTKFEELTPVWFSLINKDDSETKEALFLKENTGEFWQIINKTNLKLAEIGVIKVRHTSKYGRPVIYLFTFSFLPNSERTCSHAGDYLMNMAKKSIKGL